MKRVIAVDIIPSFLILLFAYTAIAKLIEHNSFRMVIAQMMDIPIRDLMHGSFTGADLIAWSVPLSELFIVLLLFFQRSRIYGLFAFLSLMVVFTSYLGYMVLFRPHLPCSCGGVIGSMGWGMHIAFNVVVMAMIVWSAAVGALKFKV